MADIIQGEKQYIDAFFKLTLKPTAACDLLPMLKSLDSRQRRDFFDLADSNHVVIRVFEVINRVAGNRGDINLQAWAVGILAAERDRIAHALQRLKPVVDALEQEDCPVAVMKSLDHWPDLGNDLDLVSTGSRSDILRVFTQKFHAKVEGRSWGDRLACKWNFALPGLRESIETHVGRLGQTGEHIALAHRLVDRRETIQVEGLDFFVPAPEERIFAATLQRMYRHFYFRVCDILNAASLVDEGRVDFSELRNAAEHAGIWQGVASFLHIVSDFVRRYRGWGLSLPREVTAAATVGAEKMYTHGRFLRVPIIPCGVRLFAREIMQMAIHGNVPATLRLSLLPPLASAAAVASRITGSDKGIW
jgi:hypothetical protein